MPTIPIINYSYAAECDLQHGVPPSPGDLQSVLLAGVWSLLSSVHSTLYLLSAAKNAALWCRPPLLLGVSTDTTACAYCTEHPQARREPIKQIMADWERFWCAGVCAPTARRGCQSDEEHIHVWLCGYPVQMKHLCTLIWLTCALVETFIRGHVKRAPCSAGSRARAHAAKCCSSVWQERAFLVTTWVNILMRSV